MKIMFFYMIFHVYTNGHSHVGTRGERPPPPITHDRQPCDSDLTGACSSLSCRVWMTSVRPGTAATTAAACERISSHVNSTSRSSVRRLQTTNRITSFDRIDAVTVYTRPLTIIRSYSSLVGPSSSPCRRNVL